jgi:hypothetical protein
MNYLERLQIVLSDPNVKYKILTSLLMGIEVSVIAFFLTLGYLWRDDGISPYLAIFCALVSCGQLYYDYTTTRKK